jgi:hypothetical protein
MMANAYLKTRQILQKLFEISVCHCVKNYIKRMSSDYFPLKGLERLAPIFYMKVNGISMMCTHVLVTRVCPKLNCVHNNI